MISSLPDEGRNYSKRGILSTTTVIIGDIHSRWQKLRHLMLTIGLMDGYDGKRLPGFHVVQLGDAVSLGYGMQEAEFYKTLDPWIDEWIVGNHEAPALWPYDDRFKFYGYMPGDMGLSGCDPACMQLVAARAHEYKMATTVGDWLVTHAGVHPRHQKNNGWDTAEKAAAGLNKMWDDHFTKGLHDYRNCEICDPGEERGGCLWLRWHGLRAGYRAENHIKQVLGHTPSGPEQDKSGQLWMIDTKKVVSDKKLSRNDAEWFGGVAALVTKDDGKTMELVYEP